MTTSTITTSTVTTSTVGLGIPPAVELADSCDLETGTPADGSFVAVYRQRGRPVAVLGINQPQQFMSIRRRLASVPTLSSLQGASA